MEYRKIPGIETPVSVVAFGCGPGAALMVGDDVETQEEAVAGALDRGLNFFDTAAFYGSGKSEIALGGALTRLGAHDKAVILTKISVLPTDFEDIESAVLRAADEGRRRLKRDVIDILLLHNRVGERLETQTRSPALTVNEATGAVTAAFERLKADGKVLAYGFSSFRGSPASMRAVLEKSHPAMINACFNLLNPSAGYPVGPTFASAATFDPPDYECLIDEAAKRGIGTIVIQPLSAGLLGRPGGPQIVQILRAHAEKHGRNLLSLAASFCLSKPGVISLAWGFKRTEQMLSALEAVASPPLQNSEISTLLKEIHAGE